MTSSGSHADSTSAGDPVAPRRSMLRHPVRSEEGEGEVRPGALSSHLSKHSAGASPAGSGKVERVGGATSSLPAALARADESREKSREARKGGGTGRNSRREWAGFPNWLFDFRGFADGLHPAKGWGQCLLLALLSGLAWSQVAFPWLIPDHPGPLPLMRDLGFLVTLLMQDIGMGFLGWVVSGLFIHMGFWISGGRPPFLWTLKVVVFAFLPFTVFRLGLFLMSNVTTGQEAFLRGYRPEWFQSLSPPMAAALLSWGAVRMVQATGSKHCQGRRWLAGVVFLPVPILAWVLVWGVPEMQAHRFEEEAGEWWREGEAAWRSLEGELALSRLEKVGEIPRVLSVEQKKRLYLMRGEVRYEQGDVQGAREDMLRMTYLMPPRSGEHRLGRAVNLLLLERPDLAMPHLYAAQVMKPQSPDVFRWLSRTARGEFGETDLRVESSERHARTALGLDGSLRNQRELYASLKVLGRYDALVAELEGRESGLPGVEEIRRWGVEAAERTGREELVERWGGEGKR